MYYYRKDGSWNQNAEPFLPTGSVGLAKSDNGVSWYKVVGSACPGESVLVPSNVEDDFDLVHISVGDVVRIDKGGLHMYYFGGSTELVSMGRGDVKGI